jgi:outer membrane receptor protein involved in Fe transport
MKKFIPFILLIIAQCSVLCPARAQQGTITGVVKDDAGQPQTYATVALLHASDSSLVKGAVTDESGRYVFTPEEAGRFMIVASVVGLIKGYSAPFDFERSASVQVPALVLTKNAQLLKSVNVTASKPFIQHEIDKTVVNVENSIVSAGNSAWEILQKSPGVSVDNSNNTIRLQGKTGVVVYMDGKPTYLSADQLANMLKNLNASDIQSVEIMTQPSAKYDAAGNAGVINIVTRKSRKVGFNGTLTAGYTQGRYGRENAGVNLNYRHNKINLYGSYNFTHAKWWNKNYITRNFYEQGDKHYSTRTEQLGIRTSPSNFHNFKAGVDYYLDERNILSFMVNGSLNTFTPSGQNTTWFMNGDGSAQSSSLTRNNEVGKWTNYTYDLNYNRKFDSTGHELTIDVAYSRFDNSMQQHFHTDAYYPDGSPLPDEEAMPNPNIRKGSLPSIIDIKTAKIDYTLPLKKDMKLELGAKSSLVTSDNDVRYFQLDNARQQWDYDSATNHFKYTENINAAYVNFSKQFKKGWALQLGLRGEQTVSKGRQFTSDTAVDRNYLQLFPSVFLSKKLNKDHALNFSYSRRINRPNYQDLNPFRYYLDPYTYQEGNPFLQPELTHSLKLSYSYKSWFSTSLGYSRTRDVMSEVLKQDDSAKITFDTEDNLSRMQNVDWNTSLSIPVTKWWMSNTFVDVFYNLYQGKYLGGDLDFGSAAYTINSTNTFTLPKGFTLELSGWYRSQAQWSIFTVHPQGGLNFGVQKTLMHDKATLKLNVNDIFKTSYGFAKVRYQNLDVTAENHWISQSIGLTFSYRFNKGNVKPERHRQSAIEEEQSRIKK